MLTRFAIVPAFCVLCSLSAQPQVLEKGRPIEGNLIGSKGRQYEVAMQQGQFSRVVVDQLGVDLVVRVFSPDQQNVLEVDSPNGANGPEIVEFEARKSGVYRIEVRSFTPDSGDGRYTIMLQDVLDPGEYATRLENERATQHLVSQWVRNNAVRLRGADPQSSRDDLQPLRRLIGTARVVALGEATHGTREFFQLKHRVFDFLVREMGFNIFAIEATMPESFDLNEYVLTGKGNPSALLSGLYFWTWDTEEVFQLIRWMREYNADPGHTRKLKFYGFDMQSAPRAVKQALSYLRRVDSAAAHDLEARLRLLTNPFVAAEFRALPPDLRRQLTSAARALLSKLDELPGGQEWRIARQNARVAVQFSEFPEPRDAALNHRDSAMAENLQWILRHEGPEPKPSSGPTMATLHDEMRMVGRGWGRYCRNVSDRTWLCSGFHSIAVTSRLRKLAAPYGLSVFPVLQQVRWTPFLPIAESILA